MLREGASYDSPKVGVIAEGTEVKVDKVKDIGPSPCGISSLRAHIFYPAEHVGWTTVSSVLTDLSHCL